jgi:SAM-dependent methyltransferase
MGVGKVVRRLSGPLEPYLADAYRGFFFNVNGFADRVAAMGQVGSVVEIGCGEGALITALAERMPQTQFLGLDVTSNVGRLFAGDRTRVRFECTDAAVVAEREGAIADLVIVCDVMHHVPTEARRGLWQAAETLVKRGGRIVFKEWLKNPAPIYWIGWASDRFITGDRIQYETRETWMSQIEEGTSPWGVVSEMQLSPWKTNHAFVLERTRRVGGEALESGT